MWLSVAAFLTCEVPHALQWWEVRDVALVAQRAAESALARCSGGGGGLGGTNSSMHGRSVSSGGAGGASGGYEEQHAWLVVAWALLAIEGACNVATGIPFENRCDELYTVPARIVVPVGQDNNCWVGLVYLLDIWVPIQ